MVEATIKVEVAYAKPEQQVIIGVDVATNASAEQAILTSGILEQFPEINQQTMTVGIFGKACKLDKILDPGDRVEIYRPLLIDPKEHRRQRASRNQ